MPRCDGRESIRILKSDPQLRHIPIVVLTTSDSDEDIAGAYDLGASGYVIKPARFEALVDVVNTLGKYWFDLVTLPKDIGNGQPIN